MAVDELVRLDGKRLAEITGNEDARNATMWVTRLNASMTETTIDLSVGEPASDGSDIYSDEVSIPAALASKLEGVTGEVKVFVTSTDATADRTPDTASSSTGGTGSTSKSEQTIVQSRIVSINIRDQNGSKVAVTQLTTPIRIKLHLRDEATVSHATTCFWRNESTIGSDREWREEGCRTFNTSAGRAFIVCECNHLTQFTAGERRPGGRKGALEETEEGGSSQMLTAFCAIAGLVALFAVVVLAAHQDKAKGFFGLGGQLGDTMDSVLGSATGAMEMVYQALWGMEAKMAVYAPPQMSAGETAVVTLRVWPASEDEHDGSDGTSTRPELTRHASDMSDVMIPHGTRVEATLRVIEEDAFELRASEKVTKLFSWQGKMRHVEWAVRSKAEATNGRYHRAVSIEVCWGSDSRDLSCDLTIASDAIASDAVAVVSSTMTTNPAFERPAQVMLEEEVTHAVGMKKTTSSEAVGRSTNQTAGERQQRNEIRKSIAMVSSTQAPLCDSSLKYHFFLSVGDVTMLIIYLHTHLGKRPNTSNLTPSLILGHCTLSPP
jgi:hypothetical protein